MSTKLNQIIAVSSGKKTSCTAAVTELYKLLQKPELFSGLERKYQPLDDEGEKLPSETKIVQKKVGDVLGEVQEHLIELMDIIAIQEYANCDAKADIRVGETVIAQQVPVSYILFLEKQLDNIKSIISKVPVLSSDVRWNKSQSDPSLYVTDTVTTTRTKKIPKAFVKAPATDKHPAQVEMFTEDVVVGNWNKVDISGAVAIKDRDAMLKRVDALRDAIKAAREEANSTEVKKVDVGKSITNYIFG